MIRRAVPKAPAPKAPGAAALEHDADAVRRAAFADAWAELDRTTLTTELILDAYLDRVVVP